MASYETGTGLHQMMETAGHMRPTDGRRRPDDRTRRAMKANAGWVPCSSDKVHESLYHELIVSHSPDDWTHYHFIVELGPSKCAWCAMHSSYWTTSCPGSTFWSSGHIVGDAVMHQRVDFRAGEWFIEPSFLDHYNQANEAAEREARRAKSADNLLDDFFPEPESNVTSRESYRMRRENQHDPF